MDLSMLSKIARMLILISIIGALVWLVFMLYPYIHVAKLQKYRNKHYSELKPGMSLGQFPEKWGEPEHVMPFADGTKLYYYAGVHASEDAIKEIKENVSYRSGYPETSVYAYFQIYVDQNSKIEAYTYCGESDYIYTKTGKIRGGAISVYLEKKYGIKALRTMILTEPQEF